MEATEQIGLEWWNGNHSGFYLRGFVTARLERAGYSIDPEESQESEVSR
jgi:hypothetical protein